MDPISAIFVMAVLGGLFAKGVDVATDGLFSAEVGGGVRGAGGYAVRAGRARWRLANAKAREIRMQSPQGRKVQEILDLAGMFVRVLSAEARRFGSGARSGWRTGRDQARSARTKRRGGEPWPIVRAARSGHVRAREWAERAARSGADVPNGDPNETEPNDPNETVDWDAGGGCLVVLKFTERPGRDLPVPTFCGRDCEPGWRICPEHKAERIADPDYPNDDIDEWRADPDALGPDAEADGDPEPGPNTTVESDPWEQSGTDAYLPPRPDDPARLPVRVEIYRAYVERGQWEVRAKVRRLDAGASYHAVKGHDMQSGERGWNTFHDTGWLPGMPAVVAEVRAAVLGNLGRVRAPYRIEWFVDGEPTAQPAGGGCTKVLRWQQVPGEHRTEPIFCGEPGSPTPSGRTNHCPEHQEGQADDPNGDPNVPLESTVPNQNGDVRCGCCAQLHKPLPPGEHCPNCHIHDHTPNGTTPNAPTTRGPNVSDINSAPAAINAWEAIGDRWESLQSRADTLHAEQDALTNEVHGLYVEVATLADGMGDFAIGGEADTSAAVGELADSATSAREQAGNLTTSITSAKESVDSYVAALHADFDPSIEAAAGQVADAHAVMQEA